MSYREHLISSGRPACYAGTKRKRANQESSIQEEIAWTTARCNRLLRSINSRISTLRRLIRTDFSIDRASNAGYPAIIPDKQPRREPKEHWSAVDPVWFPNGTRKLQSRTYARKAKPANAAKRSQSCAAETAKIAFPTPFVKRIGNGWPSIADVSPEMKRTPFKSPIISRRSRQLPLRCDSQRQEAEKGLEAALSTFLLQTKALGPTESKGARTLLNTCLRKVPAYIELDIEDSDEQHSADITSDTFSYLEDFGTRANGGWYGLREVVRSHGIYLICGAIKDDVISTNAIHRLIDICHSQKTVVETQQILEAWFLSSDNPSSQQIEKLNSFARYHRCQGFRFRIIQELVQRDCSNYINFCQSPKLWNDILCSLNGATRYEAVSTLSSCVAAYCRLGVRKRLKEQAATAMRDAILKLTAMAGASLALEVHTASNAILAETLHHVTLNLAFARLETQVKDSSNISALFMLCSEFVMTLECGPDGAFGILNTSALSSLLQIMTNSDNKMVDMRRDLATDLAEALIALDKQLEAGIVKQLLDRMLEVTASLAPQKPLFSQVAIEVITLHTQSSYVSEEASLAEYLRQFTASCRDHDTPQTPFLNSRKGNRFRWEDGLCEWVMATPFASINVPGAKAICQAKDEPVSLGQETLNVDRSSPQAFPEASPDVLALTPAAKRRRLSTTTPTRLGRQKRGRTVKHAKHEECRMTNELLARDVEESEDELSL